MKKIFLFLSAAVLLTAACNKSETVVRELGSNELGFRALSGNTTKAGELDGVILPNTYGIYAAATQRNASGLIENASFFSGKEHLFATADDPATAASLWKGEPAVFWPIGGVRMDFLAYAIKKTSHVSELPGPGKWLASWDYATTDIARQVSFNDVDTYANQDDLLYAAANDQTSAANGGSGKSVALEFNHAQALLIFNVKANDADKVTINEISFVTPERVAALRAYQNASAAYDPSAHDAWAAKKLAHDTWAEKKVTDEYDSMTPELQAEWDAANPEPDAPGVEPAGAPVLADLADADVTLKTVGTFTVNNERNILVSGWTFGAGATKAENYKMKSGSTLSPANVDLIASCIDYGTPVGTENTQLGETLLIPEQEKVNFTIEYTSGGNTMYYTVNDFRGVWQKGHKYVYNIDLLINEIVITEEVVDFDMTQSPVAL